MEINKILPFIAIFLVLALITVIVLFSPRTKGEKIVENIINTAKNNISEKIRKSSVAGQFYTDDPQKLSLELENYINSASKIQTQGKLRILVSPHAGTQYSGKTAGAAFKQIDPKNYKRVIILGVSHENVINKAAVISKGYWDTPLGKLHIDEEAAKKIVNGHNIIENDTAHNNEHSIELIGIFVKYLFGDVKIVPILLGQTDDTLLNSLAYTIANNFDDETLLIVSTDLSHYPNWDDAVKSDTNVINSLLTGNINTFENAVLENKSANYPNHSTSACGYEPLRVALKISDILKFKEIKKIDYTNSGDITGDKSRVVGYGAVGFYSNDITPVTLSQNAKQELLRLARATIESYVKSNTILNFAPINDELFLPLGAFVTLTENDQLRGCIGEFEPNYPLYEVIQSVSISSATKDPRFRPVTTAELDKINIEISTMTPQVQIYDWKDIKLGVHGVRIQNGNKSGTFLPQVATDNKWDLETFLQNLCTEKANLDEDCYKNPETKIYVFETDIFEETHEN